MVQEEGEDNEKDKEMCPTIETKPPSIERINTSEVSAKKMGAGKQDGNFDSTLCRPEPTTPSPIPSAPRAEIRVKVERSDSPREPETNSASAVSNAYRTIAPFPGPKITPSNVEVAKTAVRGDCGTFLQNLTYNLIPPTPDSAELVFPKNPLPQLPAVSNDGGQIGSLTAGVNPASSWKQLCLPPPDATPAIQSALRAMQAEFKAKPQENPIEINARRVQTPPPGNHISLDSPIVHSQLQMAQLFTQPYPATAPMASGSHGEGRGSPASCFDSGNPVQQQSQLQVNPSSRDGANAVEDIGSSSSSFASVTPFSPYFEFASEELFGHTEEDAITPTLDIPLYSNPHHVAVSGPIPSTVAPSVEDGNQPGTIKKKLDDVGCCTNTTTTTTKGSEASLEEWYSHSRSSEPRCQPYFEAGVGCWDESQGIVTLDSNLAFEDLMDLDTLPNLAMK